MFDCPGAFDAYFSRLRRSDTHRLQNRKRVAPYGSAATRAKTVFGVTRRRRTAADRRSVR